MPSILVIEDEETLARNIARFLEHSGWDVQIAGTAEEGLERVSSAPPDIVMLDFGLPDMDGLAALAILRKRDPQMSVVMLTGQANVQLAVDAMKSGAVDFIAKPVVLADLKRVLERLVREKRLSYEVAYHQARNSGNSDALVGRSPGMLALKEGKQLLFVFLDAVLLRLDFVAAFGAFHRSTHWFRLIRSFIASLTLHASVPLPSR